MFMSKSGVPIWVSGFLQFFKLFVLFSFWFLFLFLFLIFGANFFSFFGFFLVCVFFFPCRGNHDIEVQNQGFGIRIWLSKSRDFDVWLGLGFSVFMSILAHICIL